MRRELENRKNNSSAAITDKFTAEFRRDYRQKKKTKKSQDSESKKQKFIRVAAPSLLSSIGGLSKMSRKMQTVAVCATTVLMHLEAHMRLSPTRPRTLLKQRESPGFGYTFTHLWNIDFRRRTPRRRGKLFIYSPSVRHTRGLSASKPHEIVPLPGQIDPRGQQAGEAKGAN